MHFQLVCLELHLCVIEASCGTRGRCSVGRPIKHGCTATSRRARCFIPMLAVVVPLLLAPAAVFEEDMLETNEFDVWPNAQVPSIPIH